MNAPIYLSIIIPVYNEHDRIEACLEQLVPHAARYNCEIIFVDNGSTDDTRDLIDVAKTIYRPVRSIRQERRGKGAAVRAGMLAATGRYRYMCDVDLSTPAREIHRFLEFARVYDVVIGSREIHPEQTQTTWKRRTIGRIFHRLVSPLVPGVVDTQCGFKMFRDYAADAIFTHTTIDGMAFDVEALYLALEFGYSLHEIPVPWVNDPRSRVRLVGDGLDMLRDVLWLRDDVFGLMVRATRLQEGVTDYYTRSGLAKTRSRLFPHPDRKT